MGVALQATHVDIFTDVGGVAAADPHVVPAAPFLSRISYGAMTELARFGARVVHPQAILAGWKGRVPISVRSTFSTHAGTLIEGDDDPTPFVGVAVLPPMRTLALPPRSVDMATRAAWEHRRRVMSVVDSASGRIFVGASADKAGDLRAVLAGIGNAVTIDDEGCWLSIIGTTDRVRHAAAGWQRTLLDAEIPVQGHGIAERRCTFLMSNEHRDRAVALLYDAIWGNAAVQRSS